MTINIIPQPNLKIEYFKIRKFDSQIQKKIQKYVNQLLAQEL